LTATNGRKGSKLRGRARACIRRRGESQPGQTSMGKASAPTVVQVPAHFP
jgi:hypothetical protein